MGNKAYVFKSLEGFVDAEYLQPSRLEYHTTYCLWTLVNTSGLITQPLFLNAIPSPGQPDDCFSSYIRLEGWWA